MGRLTKSELEGCKAEFEGGMTLAAIAKKHGVSYDVMRRCKRKQNWTVWRSPEEKKLKIVAARASQIFRRDDGEDRRLVEIHKSDWQMLRRMLQRSIDATTGFDASFVRTCAETVAIIQTHERELRALSTKVRLRVLALTHPKGHASDQTQPGRFSPSIRRPEQAHPALAGQVKTIDELVQVWMPSDPPASKAHRRSWLKHIESFCDFVGHRELRLISSDDAFRWRDSLLLAGMTARTVHNGRIAALRALFQYAVHAGVLSDNPFRQVVFRYDPRPFQRRGYTAAEARQILSASLEPFPNVHAHTRAMRRWIPWLCALSGARVGEVMQLRKTDVCRDGDIPFFVVDPDAGPVKGYVGRKVPIHPQLVEQGFEEFVAQRPDGYLFADERGFLPRFTSIHALGKWIRAMNIGDKKIAPLHSFRHRFKSVAREVGIGREYHDAITGHRRDRTRGDDYGEVPFSALYREIGKIPRIRLAG